MAVWLWGLGPILSSQMEALSSLGWWTPMDQSVPDSSTGADWYSGCRCPSSAASGNPACIIWLEHFLPLWGPTWEPHVGQEAAWWRTELRIGRMTLRQGFRYVPSSLSLREHPSALYWEVTWAVWYPWDPGTWTSPHHWVPPIAEGEGEGIDLRMMWKENRNFWVEWEMRTFTVKLHVVI